MSTPRLEFTEDMNEVSGFGGFYERCCRAGVCAGAAWALEHRHARPVFEVIPDILGLIVPGNDEARSLQRAVDTALVTRDDGTKVPLGEELTALQFHAIVEHVLFIAAQGWKAYVTYMTAPVNVYRADGTRIERT